MNRITALIQRLISAVSRQFPVFNLRLPEDLKDRVMKSARRNNRSQNAEFLHRLESSFQQNDDLLKLLVEEVQALRREVAELKDQSKASDS